MYGDLSMWSRAEAGTTINIPTMYMEREGGVWSPFGVSVLLVDAMYTDIWTHDYVVSELINHRDEIMESLVGDLPLEAVGWRDLPSKQWVVELEAWGGENVVRYHRALRDCRLGYLILEKESNQQLVDSKWSIGVSLRSAGLIDNNIYNCIMTDGGERVIERLVAESSGELSVKLKQLLRDHGLGSVWSKRANTVRAGEFVVVKPSALVVTTGGCIGCRYGYPTVLNRPCGHKELCYRCWWKRLSGAHRCKKCNEVVIDYA